MADNIPDMHPVHPLQSPDEVWDLTVGITTNRYLGPPSLRIVEGGLAQREGAAPANRRALSLVASAVDDKPIRGRGCPCAACEADRRRP
ncbi:hypothetical protein [Sabulicella glaciei]|uniref:hypothetical protein n=1 Tax=Sabulicella glaciei TaxID=2984948 RepID=UPI0026599C7E|nr:hypothetical protein [Roseococcus sp. MDT2-1-1]